VVKLKKILKLADLASTRAPAATDLAPYVEIIDTIKSEGGVGAEVVLEPGESQRTEKRRLSLAARARKLKLTWRTAPQGTLRFVLSEPGEAAPGGRRRRAAQG